METRQLIAEILKHKELHDLITHLGDFKEAVEGKLEEVESCPKFDHCYEYQADILYWERQLKVVDHLIEVTKENSR